MEVYLDEILNRSPEDINGTETTHLFKLFRCVITQILCMEQLNRTGWTRATSFLTKCVGHRTPGKDEYNKMVKMPKHMHRTKFPCLTIKAEYLDQNHCFVDATFAVHDNLKSHTDAYVPF